MDRDALMALQQQLREEMLPWILAPYLLIAYALITLEPGEGLVTNVGLMMGLALLVLVCGAWLLRKRHYVVAAWGTAVGTFAILLSAHTFFPQADLHHALLVPIVGAALTLGVWQSVVIAGMASLFLVIHVLPLNPAALVGSGLALWSVTFFMAMSQRSHRTILTWAWDGYEQARSHLETARDRQVELKQALADLELATRETVRLNEVLAAARAALEETQRAKQEFVANVSHEFRTPLNMIIGFSDIILEQPETYARRLPTALLTDIAAIRRNSQHLADLVNDVLNMSELDIGGMQLFREWTPIQDVLAEATEAVLALFDKKGLSLNVEVPVDIPPVYCDRTRIRQVVLNLLSNAGRFTEQGGTTIRAEMQNGDIIVSVADTGPGMDRATLGHMFEPFQQGEPIIRRRYGGTGLGLAISKRFVEMHGGRIWLESQVGRGTTAFFRLPIHAPIPEKGLARWFSPYDEHTMRTRRSLAPEISAKPRVVILETAHALDQLITRYLESMEPVVVTTPEEAASTVETSTAVALVVNVPPDLREDTLQRLSRLSLDVPVLSCWVPDPNLALRRLGAQAYLVKPVDRLELVERVRETAPSARTILLVDDDAGARQLFSRILTTADRRYAVIEAEDGEAAMALLRERHPDLLLLDLMMPNVDGFTLLEAKLVDETIRDIPVVILSAKDPQRDPIIAKEIAVTRQDGLSARDLMLALEAITGVLRPQFGPQAPSASPRG